MLTPWIASATMRPMTIALDGHSPGDDSAGAALDLGRGDHGRTPRGAGAASAA
jgi:hypothetical protein